MRPRHLELIVVFTLLAAAAHAQHMHPYSDQEVRTIKALLVEEVTQYLGGGGMGYARAAELNQYPGPMHVLELAEKLMLTAAQRVQTQKLMDVHKEEARQLGREVVDAEQALEHLFHSDSATESQLAAVVDAAAMAKGRYRLSHLETHRRMKALLTPQQVARYDELRGYSVGDRSRDHPNQH